MKGATSIQERLWELRKDKGLNLEELSELTGISKSALGSYEKEDFKEINHGNLITLADFYGVSVDYLLCRTCLLYTSPSPRDGLLSRMPSSA